MIWHSVVFVLSAALCLASIADTFDDNTHFHATYANGVLTLIPIADEPPVFLELNDKITKRQRQLPENRMQCHCTVDRMVESPAANKGVSTAELTSMFRRFKSRRANMREERRAGRREERRAARARLQQVSSELNGDVESYIESDLTVN